jgi:dTDP-4-dehydrorhamnose reductase
VATILQLAREREVIPVVDDQWGCPTFTEDLAAAIADLIRTRAYGIYHVTNSGPATWYELASTAVRLAGLSTRVEPIPTSALSRPAARPRYSVLDPFPLPHILGYQLPHWRDALSRYVLCMGP